MPSSNTAIVILPISTSRVLCAIGIASLNVIDCIYTNTVSRLRELDTNQRVVFRTSTEDAPAVFCVAICAV